MRLTHLFSLGCMLVLLAASSTALQAESERQRKQQVSDQQQKLSQVREQLQQIQQSLQLSERERGGVEHQLGEIERKLNESRRSLYKVQKKLKSSIAELRGLKQDQQQLESELLLQKDNLAAQLRTAYYLGNQEHFKLLLNQQEPAAIARTFKYFEYLNKARLSAIDDTRSLLKGISKNKKQIQNKQLQLTRLNRQQEQDYQQIKKTRDERKVLLQQIQEKILEQKKTAAVLKRDEATIRELLATLQGIFSDIPAEVTDINFADMQGAMFWPVSGRRLNSFGDSRADSDLTWQGVRIAAAEGDEVIAVSHGRVAFADWMPGFGLILIIDHSNGFMSLYGHNRVLYKETGDWVNVGEVIAQVGNTGGEEKSALYFEIRHNGKPLNPAKWCTNRNVAAKLAIQHVADMM